MRNIIRETPIICGDIKLEITVSVGVESFRSARDAKDLIRLADENLYLSKSKGKDEVN